MLEAIGNVSVGDQQTGVYMHQYGSALTLRRSAIFQNDIRKMFVLEFFPESEDGGKNLCDGHGTQFGIRFFQDCSGAVNGSWASPESCSDVHPPHGALLLLAIRCALPDGPRQPWGQINGAISAEPRTAARITERL